MGSECALQVLGLLVEVMKRDFQRHISTVLPVTRNILQSTINKVGDGLLDLSDEATIPFWKEAYYTLLLLEKILCQFPNFILNRDFEVVLTLFLSKTLNKFYAMCSVLFFPGILILLLHGVLMVW